MFLYYHFGAIGSAREYWIYLGGVIDNHAYSIIILPYNAPYGEWIREIRGDDE